MEHDIRCYANSVAVMALKMFAWALAKCGWASLRRDREGRIRGWKKRGRREGGKEREDRVKSKQRFFPSRAAAGAAQKEKKSDRP